MLFSHNPSEEYDPKLKRNVTTALKAYIRKHETLNTGVELAEFVMLCFHIKYHKTTMGARTGPLRCLLENKRNHIVITWYTFDLIERGYY